MSEVIEGSWVGMKRITRREKESEGIGVWQENGRRWEGKGGGVPSISRTAGLARTWRSGEISSLSAGARKGGNML